LIALRIPTTGPDKEAFHRYLTDFHAVPDEAELLASFRDCTDVLPNHYAELLYLPPGSTYRDAVQLLLSPWNCTPNGHRKVPFN
jgi:hypothetical protein